VNILEAFRHPHVFGSLPAPEGKGLQARYSCDRRAVEAGAVGGDPRSLRGDHGDRGSRSKLSALLVAQDHRAALRTLLKYASAPFDLVPMLASTVVTRRTDMIQLWNGVAIAAYPCRPQAVRGLRSRVVVCDELAFFRSREGFPTDVEMLRALRPTLATTGGKLIVLSSPSSTVR
jgi:hypothetical protein